MSHGRRGRKGLASVYGFVMIYLLVIASLQAISLSVSSGQAADASAERAGQVGQLRSLEHLRVAMARGGNLTITNDGLITSSLSFLVLQNSTVSRTFPLRGSLGVGTSIVVGPTTPAWPGSSAAVVTSLGDVFAASQSSAPQSANGLTLATLGGAGVDSQIYQNPADPSRFFVSAGPSVWAFSSRGTPLWSFNASQGEVTDVLPLADGGVYVSDGYYGDQFTSNLFRLTSSGTSVSTYTMRLLRLYTSLEIQLPDGDQAPYPVGSQPVQKGLGYLYAFYDGWFFSSSGPDPTSVAADSYNFASSDSDQAYLFTAFANPGGYGCTEPRGSLVQMYAYSTTALGVAEQWSTTVFLNFCDLYPPALIASTAGSGIVASLFSETYWSQPSYFGGPYQGSNPFLAVLSSSGTILRSGDLDSSGYVGLAEDGNHVYLSIPSTDQVEVLPAVGVGQGAFYNIGIPATKLVWSGSSLLAVSPSVVKVFDSSMNLKKTVDFSPLSLYSPSNSRSLEPQMVDPSFIILNSTNYVALLRNSTGFGTLLMGAYSP